VVPVRVGEVREWLARVLVMVRVVGVVQVAVLVWAVMTVVMVVWGF
jgi:hypothetical protein